MKRLMLFLDLMLCAVGCGKMESFKNMMFTVKVDTEDDGFTEKTILALYKISSKDKSNLDEIQERDRIRLKKLSHDLSRYIEASQKR